MTDDRPPLAAFDDGTVDDIARETGLDAATLRTVASRHQEGIRDLPGVDDIVYEWRNHFHLDPLVHRTEAVYVLALPDHVWEEFADRLECSTAEFDALKTLHDRQARTIAPTSDRFDTDAALVLTRPGALGRGVS
jgi:hypothetical protein